jgi:hypothetical protein
MENKEKRPENGKGVYRSPSEFSAAWILFIVFPIVIAEKLYRGARRWKGESKLKNVE